MRLALRITGTLCLVAVCAGGLLYLLASANLVRFDVLPLLLFSTLFLSSAFFLCIVLVEIPFRTLLRHLEINDKNGLCSFSEAKGDFSRLAKIIVQSAANGVPDKNSSAGGPGLQGPQETTDAFHDIVESISDAILLIDTAGTITFCNRSAAAIYGAGSGKKLCNKPLGSLAAPEQQSELQRHIDNALHKKQSDTFAITMLKNDGSRFDAGITLSAIIGDTGTADACSVLVRDSTSSKESDEKKQIMEQQLRAVYKMEALGQLARGIAHDLNNSLGAISGYVELLKKANPAGDERTQRYVSMIASAAQRSGGIIHQLLTYARKNHMEIISFDVNEVIADIAKLLESSLDKNIAIVQELGAKDAAIVGDPGQIQNSIVNLAINARDAMSKSGGTLTFKTENIVIDGPFAKSRPYKMTVGYYLMIAVSDTGVGMDKPTLGHLFEPFFTTKEIGKGTGLGLASVYGSLKSHHGYIEVDSEVARGSTFTMYLPVNQTMADNDEETAKTGSAPAPARKQHIMIIDDDRSLVEMLGELLSWLGYSVTPFLTASAAIEYYLIHHHEIDLSIIDWKMPEIDGMECYRRMKAINPRLLALLSTGYCLDDEQQSILNEGVNGILPKPFVSAQLSSAIADVLA
jgi:PAS domain S-box-containing protein